MKVLTRDLDGLAKSMATTTSRRRLLAGLAGGLGASLLGADAALADCKRTGSGCSHDEDCCSGICAGRRCAPAGSVRCANGKTATCQSGQLVDPKTCACKNCVAGCPDVPCPPGRTCQDGQCIDPR